MAIFRLDFRPIFRAHGKRDRDAYANAVSVAAVSSPGRGGGIHREIRKLRVRVRRWGYVIPFSEIGQKLTWLLGGALRARQGRQRPRPVTYDDDAPADELVSDLVARAHELVSRYDQATR